MQRFVRAGAGFWSVLCLAGSLSFQAIAQTTETEPNNTCLVAQDIGAIDDNSPFTVSGSVDTPPDIPDVDFFRFEATPGALLVADQEGADSGKGTLLDPFLGLFDSECNLLAVNDDSGSLNSRLQFVVPADGVFVLAASSCCDNEFTGGGGSDGTYELTIAPASPAIDSIAGRVVAAISGEPLPGSSPPFASVELLRCLVIDCTSVEVVASENTDDEGRFRFERDSLDQPLPIGTYQVAAFADEFEQSTTDSFDVGEGEDFDVGDIPLNPPPILFSDIQTCEDLPPQGGTCRYSVIVRNNTSGRLEGLTWSLVDGYGLGSSLTFTLFEASTTSGPRRAVRQHLSVKPFGDQTLQFRFDVPPFVLGATFCTYVFLGLNPDPLVITVREAPLFCITGADTGFQVMSEGESQKVFKGLGGKSEMPRKLRAR